MHRNLLQQELSVIRKHNLFNNKHVQETRDCIIITYKYIR